MRLQFGKIARQMVAAVAAVMLAASCTTQRTSLTYFEDITGVESGSLQSKPQPIKIMPDDELQITISSLEPEATAPYNAPTINPTQPQTKSMSLQPQQLNYFVNAQGDIDMPVLGRIHVAGMTVGELTEKIAELVSRDVKDPFVHVELKNFKVQVLGEVREAGIKEKAPGRESMTVLEAIAQAGDMTEFSDRSNVMVLRRDDNGTLSYHRLNLNDKSSLESPYFYLEQNDVVIIPPTRVRQDNAKYNSNNAFKLQVVSAVVSVVSVIASLVIALVVK